MLVSVFVVGFGLGAVVPLVRAAPRVGDLKFENGILKVFIPTAEKPLVVRAAGTDYTVVGTVEVQDDYAVFQLKSKDPATAWIRLRDISAMSQIPN